MSLDVASDIATGAAATLVGGSVTGGAIWLRTKLRKLAWLGTTAEQDAMVAVLDDENATPEELGRRLAPLIEAHLRQYPVARGGFEALAFASPTIYNQVNHGGGPFIGGDNHGGLTINSGGPAA